MPPETRSKPRAIRVRASAARCRRCGAGRRVNSGVSGLAEAHRLGGDHVHQRTALESGEHRLVELLRDRGARQHESAARPPQRLVRGARHEVGVRHRARMEARRHQSRDVRHVHHEHRADRRARSREALEVDHPRIRARARHEELRAVLLAPDARLRRSRCGRPRDGRRTGPASTAARSSTPGARG